MIQLLEIFFDSLLPVLICAGIGFWAGRQLELSPRPVSTLLYNVFSPAFVFSEIFNSTLSGSDFLGFYVLTVTFQVLMALTAYIVTSLQRVEGTDRASVMLASFCLNAGNFGLPIVSFALPEEALSWAVIVFVSNISVNYTLGVFVASNGRATPAQALRNVFKSPALYAVIAAFVLRGLNLTPPLALVRAADTLGNGAIPMMLVLLGLQIGQFTRFSKPRLIFTGVSLKLLFAPALATALALLANLPPIARSAFILQASMPTAVLTIVLATEFDCDKDMTLNLILMATLLSPITLSVLILLLR